MVRRLFLVVVIAVLISCAPHSDLISVAGVAATGNGSTLLVGVTLPDVEGRSCWADVNIIATDDGEVVRLDVRARKSHTPDCTPQPQRVDLAKPLGARTVRDGATGGPASLLPVLLPGTTWLPVGWKVLSSGGGKDGWFQQVGIVSSTMSVQVDLFRTGTNADLRGSTITSSATVQGRTAAFVKVRYFTAGPDALVVMDATWTVMVSSFNDLVTTETLRQIADGMNPLPFAATVEAPTIEAPETGTVAELIDYEGPTNLTGWLTIDSTGRARFCESLADDGGCEGASVDIDWATANAAPPADLIATGDRNVSDRALTLSGTLKGRVLSVGL